MTRRFDVARERLEQYVSRAQSFERFEIAPELIEAPLPREPLRFRQCLLAEALPNTFLDTRDRLWTREKNRYLRHLRASPGQRRWCGNGLISPSSPYELFREPEGFPTKNRQPGTRSGEEPPCLRVLILCSASFTSRTLGGRSRLLQSGGLTRYPVRAGRCSVGMVVVSSQTRAFLYCAPGPRFLS